MEISNSSNLANQIFLGREIVETERVQVEKEDLDNNCQHIGFHGFSSSSTEREIASFHSRSQPLATESISISMPSSLLENNFQNNKRVSFIDNRAVSFNNYTENSFSTSSTTYGDKQAKFRPQQITTNSKIEKPDSSPISQKSSETPPKSPNRPRDTRFDYFKTKSGRFERQFSILRGKPQENAPVVKESRHSDKEHIPVDRYYAALEGPELETLRAKEEILLPEDKLWPFLLRFPVSSFGICLGLSSQAILWKTLAISSSTKFLRVNLYVNLVLWCISVALLIIIFSIYLLKIIFYFEAVRREYYHPIRINFFFAPWIASLFVALGVPEMVAKNLNPILWYILMAPILCLELKIYGQWMSGGRRRLSKVANPSNHLSVVGNFVGALLGASMGLKEGPLFFFAIGLAHYTVLFVTLYQRLPTNETLPRELHPVFFLFVAAPSVAFMAWAKLEGSFDYGSRISYFIALFLYFSLAIRVNFFIGFKFSLAWWAYTFPMTGAAIATIKYANEVPNIATKGLSVILSATSTLTVTSLFVTTILHAFYLKDLLPNDLAIAISDHRPKPTMSWLYRSGSSENIAHYLKFTDTDTECTDIESSVTRVGHASKMVKCSSSTDVHKDQSSSGDS